MSVVFLVVGLVMGIGGWAIMIGADLRSDKYSGLFLSAMGGFLVTASLWSLSVPSFNQPVQVIRVKSGDTLYVAPKDGYRGLAIVVVHDSLGRRLVARDFVAQHVISPAIK